MNEKSLNWNAFYLINDFWNTLYVRCVYVVGGVIPSVRFYLYEKCDEHKCCLIELKIYFIEEFIYVLQCFEFDYPQIGFTDV